MPLNLDALDELIAEEQRKQEDRERVRAMQESKPAFAAVPLKDEIIMMSVDMLEDHPSYAQGVPFRAPSEERIAQIAESIRRNGVLSPLLIRPLTDGRYQILAGHTRKRAAMRLGYDKLPCIIKEVEDAEATDILISDNLAQRLNGLLPSEKAFAYKMRLDSMRRRAGRPLKENCDHDGHNLLRERSIDCLAEESPDSKTQIQRYIRLTYLIPELLQMVDDQKLGLVIGVSLSYLTEQTQHILLDYLSAHPKVKLKKATADELRKLDEDPVQEITADMLEELLEAQPQRAPRVLKLQLKPFRQYFPANAKPEEIALTIAKALDFYFSNTAE